MSSASNLSGHFDSLVKKLQENPDSALLKQQLVSCLPAMRSLAKIDPMAEYRLAQIYSSNSPQYKKLMEHAANNHCTPAMFAMVKLLLESKSETNLVKAASYVRKIHLSEDSYMIKQSNELIAAHSELAGVLKDKTSERTQIGFFSTSKNVEPDEKVILKKSNSI